MRISSFLRVAILSLSVALLSFSSCENKPEEYLFQRKRPAFNGSADYFQILDFNLSQTEFKLAEYLCKEKPFPEGLGFKAAWVDKDTDNDPPFPVDATFYALERLGPVDVKNLQEESKRKAYIDIVESRVNPVRQSYYDYCEKVGNWQNIWFYNVFIKGTPSIVANHKLFGREAGDDLSDFFFADFGLFPPVSVNKSGNSYVLNEFVEQQVPFRERFNTGASFSGLLIGTHVFPDELLSNEPVTVTISIPVTVDHVWEYALEYSYALKYNQATDNLEEKYSDMVIILQVQLN